MMWSVSMLSPNFQARPRTVLGSVIGARSKPASAGTRGYSCETGRHLVEHLARVRDHACDRARRRHRRVGEIDLRLRVAHAAREVALGRAQADLALAEHAHMPTQAGAARRGRPRGP